VSVAKELIESLRQSRERGEDPGVGRTAKPVTGFKGRSGRQFRAKLKLEQDDEGKWRVDFDEEWATSPRARPPEQQEQEADGSNGAQPEAQPEPARSAS
jgi:DNA topoisomerase III